MAGSSKTCDSQNAANVNKEDDEERDSPDPSPFPSISSSWKRNHLENLKVIIDEITYETSPKELVRLLIQYDRRKDFNTWKTNISNLDSFVETTADAVEDAEAYQLLDCDFGRLSKRRGIVEWLAVRRDMWEIKLNSTSDATKMNQMKQFRENFKIAGEEFTERLFYCIDLKDKNHTISEHIFQHLFISFLQLFNIKSSHFVPSKMREKCMEINGVEITGIPDNVINWFRYTRTENDTFMDWKTLLICEVKKHYGDTEEPPAKQRRFSTQQSSPVPSTVLGQHGAELLLYYPSSVSDGHVLGMIVEQTHIRLAALSITQEQYEKLKNGNLKSNTNGPKIFLTKPYDYLILEDRRCLTKALLTIGYLQKQGAEFFLK